MDQLTTTCPRDCYDTCGLVATLDDEGKIAGLRGDPEHPMTQGITCPRAAKDLVRYHMNRVYAPVVRGPQGWQHAGWEAALDCIARRLRQTLDEHGPDAVLLLDYAGNTGLLTQAFPQRLWHALDSTFTDHALCSQSGSTALALHYGQRYGVDPEDLPDAQLIAFWGFNAATSSPHLWALARQAQRKRGGQILAIDPRRSESARAADLWIAPRPGSDVALAYGVMDQLIRRGHIDRKFLAEWTLGFDALAARASEWPLERVSQVTGIAPSDVEALVHAYAGRRPGATLIGIGLQKNAHGADQVRAVSFIPTILGQHRGWYYSNGDAWEVNAASLSGAALTGTPQRLVPQVAVPKMLQAGRFQFVYVHGMNPAITLTDLNALRAGLAREDVFTVVHETHWTATARCADVVLPALTYLEKDDLVLPWSHRYVQYSHQLMPRLTEGRSEVAVMRSLAQRLGLRQEWLYADPWQAVQEALAGAVEDGTFQDLQSGARLKLRRSPQDRYPTASGKIEFESSQAAARGWDALPRQAPLPDHDGALTLLTSATREYTHSQFQEVYGSIPAMVQIHPQDAQRLGVEDGQVVELANELGHVRFTAAVTVDVPPGVLWAPRQSVGLNGRPQNALMTSEPQEIGGGPRFNSCRVVVRVAGEASL